MMPPVLHPHVWLTSECIHISHLNFEQEHALLVNWGPNTTTWLRIPSF